MLVCLYLLTCDRQVTCPGSILSVVQCEPGQVDSKQQFIDFQLNHVRERKEITADE